MWRKKTNKGFPVLGRMSKVSFGYDIHSYKYIKVILF